MIAAMCCVSLTQYMGLGKIMNYSEICTDLGYTSSLKVQLSQGIYQYVIHFSCIKRKCCHIGRYSSLVKQQVYEPKEITRFSSREAAVSSFKSPGFFGAPFEPAAGILTSYH